MITVEIKQDPTKPVEPKYPYIGLWKGGFENIAILFTSKNTGCRLNGEIPGYFGKTWTEGGYTPLKGSITLTQ